MSCECWILFSKESHFTGCSKAEYFIYTMTKIDGFCRISFLFAVSKTQKMKEEDHKPRWLVSNSMDNLAKCLQENYFTDFANLAWSCATLYCYFCSVLRCIKVNIGIGLRGGVEGRIKTERKRKTRQLARSKCKNSKCAWHRYEMNHNVKDRLYPGAK